MSDEMVVHSDGLRSAAGVAAAIVSACAPCFSGAGAAYLSRCVTAISGLQDSPQAPADQDHGVLAVLAAYRSDDCVRAGLRSGPLSRRVLATSALHAIAERLTHQMDPTYHVQDWDLLDVVVDRAVSVGLLPSRPAHMSSSNPTFERRRQMPSQTDRRQRGRTRPARRPVGARVSRERVLV